MTPSSGGVAGLVYYLVRVLRDSGSPRLRVFFSSAAPLRGLQLYIILVSPTGSYVLGADLVRLPAGRAERGVVVTAQSSRLPDRIARIEMQNSTISHLAWRKDRDLLGAERGTLLSRCMNRTSKHHVISRIPRLIRHLHTVNPPAPYRFLTR